MTAGEEDAAVLGADDDRPSPGGQTAGIEVVGEPFGEPGLTALEASAAVEQPSVEGGPATPVTGGRAQEHGVAGEGDGATVVRVKPAVVPSPGVSAVRAQAESVGGDTWRWDNGGL